MNPSHPIAEPLVAWNMADLTGSFRPELTLAASGDVRVGVPLSGSEREASLARGGDGHVATFTGGHLVTEAAGANALSPSSLTLCVRFRAAADFRDGPLLTLTAAGSSFDLDVGLSLRHGERALDVELHTAFREAPLRLHAPIGDIGPDDWHDVIVSCSGYGLALYMDGVLVDEEWPAGVPKGLIPMTLRIGGRIESAPGIAFHGSIDHVILWNRRLTDDEVVALSGGSGAVGLRARQLLGSETPMGQFWIPRGVNTSVGDCMPFYDGRRYHLFYLFDRRSHGSKWGLGAHQWAHASTSDLLVWEHHPMAVPITDEREGSICTGSVFLHDGVYHAYYSTRAIDGSPAPLGEAISHDGIRFSKTDWEQSLAYPYNGPSARDPHVFQDPQDGRFHMLVTTSLIDSGSAPEGCLAHLLSDDLQRWELLDPFLIPNLPGEPECPEWFEWNGRFYLVFSIEGAARYRIASSPLGPWTAPPIDTFDGPLIGVMKSAPYHGGRRIGAGFLRRPEGYGGSVVFREIVQRADGTLSTRWPPEMIPT